MPWLCVAGVLHHPCDHEQESEGGHESDCPTDPCASATATPVSERAFNHPQQVAKVMPLVVAGIGSSWTNGLKCGDAAAVVPRGGAPPDRVQLPIPLSDIPLLI